MPGSAAPAAVLCAAVSRAAITVRGAPGEAAQEEGNTTGRASPLAGVPRHTVSGFSAGGDMAAIHFVAASSAVDACGIIGGAPYGCNILPDAYDTTCGTPPRNAPWDKYQKEMTSYMQKRAADGLIDPLQKMSGKPLYLFSGVHDEMTYPVVMRNVEMQLAPLVGEAAVLSEYGVKASHAWVVDSVTCPNPGNPNAWCGPCGYGWEPLIENCKYDTSGIMLAHFHKGRSPLEKRAQPNNKHLKTFQQEAYVPQGWSGRSIRMNIEAYAYVPSACKGSSSASCKVHVHYHCYGCGSSNWGDQWAAHYGLNGWAETNKIIMLYPQSSGQGWDWSGTTSSKFDTLQGPQLRTVLNMLADVAKWA